ncbi:tetratricopeptide repeat protein [Micromonospora sp. NPDC007208]|uniref:tetratricopeptide repeat protein n=1 Tax=Micromonospora sp. NPDC007208 TaxID=3364236 RepID=UPI003698B060
MSEVDKQGSGAIAGRDTRIRGEYAAGRDVVINNVPESRPAPFAVPLDISDFADRTDEFSDILEMFGESAAPVVVNLFGPGGIGKSALAVRAAHRLRDRFPDGVLYAALGTESWQTADIVAEFLYLLGRPADGTTESRLVAEFRAAVAGRRILVVLDGAVSADLTVPLLPTTAGSGAIVTSRPPLPSLPGAELIEVPVLPEPDSMALVGRLARVKIDASNADQAARLVRMCGRLPLALRVAGAKLRTRADWDMGRLADRMAAAANRLDLLQIGDLEVRATLLTSYSERDPGEQRALRALALADDDEFPGWVLAPLLQVSVAESERLVERLVHAQLVRVTRVDGTGLPLYRLHDLVRDLARELLADTDPAAERAAMALRLNDRYLDLLSTAARALRDQGSGGHAADPAAPGPDDDFAELRGTIRRAPVAWFASGRDGILASLGRVAEEGRLDQVGRFADAMLSLLILTPFAEDRIRVHRLVLEAGARAGDRARLAGARRDLGRAFRDFGRYAEARAELEAAIADFADLGDAGALAETRLIYAVLLRSIGENEAAREVVLESLAHFEATGETGWQAYAHRTLGIIHRDQADWAAAGVAFDRALELFRAVGDRHREGICLVHYGSALRQQGEPGRALPLYSRARDIFAALGFALWEAVTNVHRAASLTDLEVGEEAGLLLDRALRTFTDIGDLRWADIAEYHRARLDLRSGDVAGALPRLERSASRFRELNEPYSESLVLLTLAQAQAPGPAARFTLQRLIENARRLGNPMLESTAERLLGPR